MTKLIENVIYNIDEISKSDEGLEIDKKLMKSREFGSTNEWNVQKNRRNWQELKKWLKSKIEQNCLNGPKIKTVKVAYLSFIWTHKSKNYENWQNRWIS